MTHETVVTLLVTLRPPVAAHRWNAVPALARAVNAAPMARGAFGEIRTRGRAGAASEHVVAHQTRRADPAVGTPRDTGLEATADGERQCDG